LESLDIFIFKLRSRIQLVCDVFISYNYAKKTYIYILLIECIRRFCAYLTNENLVSFKALCVLGVGLNDSPAGLAAYIIEKFSTGTNPSYKYRADGGFLEKYTYDELIDNLMIYWISNSITTAMRIYAEHYTKSNRSLERILESYVIVIASCYYCNV